MTEKGQSLVLPRLTRLPASNLLAPPYAWIAARLTAEHLVILLASLLSIGFYAWYAAHGLTLVYGDAISHMMIARRVLVGRTPGLAQLGSVWLPLNHILMLPLVWIDPFYRDGFAGAFPSMVSYVVGSLYLFRTGRLLFASQAAGWISALVFMFNPSILYMQSTAMSELVLLSTAIVAVYYLVQWTHTYRPADLVKSAGWMAAGTLVRYDGWVLTFASAVIVMYVAWRYRGRGYSQACIILFGVLAFAGGIAWFIYNWVIFGDPLYFYWGPYSAHYQQADIALHQAGLPTLHHLPISVKEYSQAVVDVVGWPVLLAAMLGFTYYLLHFRLQQKTMTAYVTLVPFAFNVAALYIGMTVVMTPEISLPGWGALYYNMRYGMMMIPAVALFLASWVAIDRRVLVPIALLIMAFSGLNPLLGTAAALEDPIHQRPYYLQQGRWLAAHYHGGTILASGAAFSPAMFDSGLPDEAFITEANKAAFHNALANLTQPQSTVQMIVMDQKGDQYDAVWLDLKSRQDWRRYFVKRATIDKAVIYERVKGP